MTSVTSPLKAEPIFTPARYGLLTLRHHNLYFPDLLMQFSVFILSKNQAEK